MDFIKELNNYLDARATEEINKISKGIEVFIFFQDLSKQITDISYDLGRIGIIDYSKLTQKIGFWVTNHFTGEIVKSNKK